MQGFKGGRPSQENRPHSGNAISSWAYQDLDSHGLVLVLVHSPPDPPEHQRGSNAPTSAVFSENHTFTALSLLWLQNRQQWGRGRGGSQTFPSWWSSFRAYTCVNINSLYIYIYVSKPAQTGLDSDHMADLCPPSSSAASSVPQIPGLKHRQGLIRGPWN